MKPAPFDYVQPDTVDEALAALAEHGDDARVLAGGQSLVAMLNMRLATPSVLIDIARIASLKRITIEGDALVVGAGVTQQDLLDWPELAGSQSLLEKILPWVGHYQTRQRGTICGSLVHADPSAELPLALATLDGDVVLESRRGRRRLTATEFQTGMMSTALAPDEMVVGCRFPRSTAPAAFHEISQRHGDFAIVAVSAIKHGDGARVGVGGVHGTPKILDVAAADAAGLPDQLNEFAWSLEARDDVHASARYRRELVRRIAADLVKEVRHAAA